MFRLITASMVLAGAAVMIGYAQDQAAPQPKPADSQPAASAPAGEKKLGSKDNPVKVSQIKEATVDGDLKEWNDVKPLPLPFAKKDAGSLKLAWTKDGLFGALTVKTDEIKVDAQNPWAGDAIEVFIEKDCARAAGKGDTENAAQYAFAPTQDGDGGDGTIVVAWGADRDQAADLKCSWKKTKEGYVLEFSIPAKVLKPAKLEEGTKLGFNFALDKAGKAAEQFFSDKDADAGYASPSTWGVIVLDK
ncbi:MAG: hypothetical protein HZA50_09040 [Planctomycetes bacterium]|nr:hypothetical protein [Planctomycetota bacterium]